MVLEGKNFSLKRDIDVTLAKVANRHLSSYKLDLGIPFSMYTFLTISRLTRMLENYETCPHNYEGICLEDLTSVIQTNLNKI